MGNCFSLSLKIKKRRGPKLSHGTSWIAEIIHWIISPNVRIHLRKVSKRSLSSIKKEPEGSFCVIFDTS